MNRCNHLDAIVVFYDVESLEQFEGVHHAWVPAIRRLFPHTPFIVCGTGIEARINKEERKLALKTRLNEILGHPMSGTLSPRRKAFGIKSTMTTYDTKNDAVAKLQSDLMPKVKAGDVVSVSFNETTYKAIYKNAFKKLTKGENRYVQSVCGKTKASRTRINNGKIAHQKQFPWIIYLSDGKTYCTGVLISSRHVLTARHCVVYRDESKCSFKNLTTVEYGGTCLYKGTDCPMGNMKIATVGGFTIPQDNAVCKKTTDLAVIFLKEKVKFNDYVKPICMSSRIHPSSLVQLKDLGFGEKRSSVMSSNLRYMDSKIVGYNWPLVITEGIDNGNNTASICSGDSGGPLQGTINGSKRTYLAGIHSQAMPCSIHGFGLTLYVPAFVNYICKLTGVCEIN
uniref:Peptidase S1 domain-containing protein n=1 Tax=Panagrellus redivivus TaxID=6233 RepID=A0A7E4V5Y3_PANRE